MNCWQAHIQVDVKVRHILIGRNPFKGCERALQKRSEYIVFFGRHVDIDFFREMSWMFLISNYCQGVYSHCWWASVLKTSLLINDITCRIGNAIYLVVICCFSTIRAHAILLAITGWVYALPRAHAHAHYFARQLMVTVKIRTLGSNVPVALSGYLVWWDSP